LTLDERNKKSRENELRELVSIVAGSMRVVVMERLYITSVGRKAITLRTAL
jgi:hypothetical protein